MGTSSNFAWKNGRIKIGTHKLLVLAVTALLVLTSTAPSFNAAGQQQDIAQAGTATRVYKGLITPVFERRISIAAGAQVTIETRRLTPGSDPVLHLLDPGGNEVAVDDNSNGGSSARLTYRAAASGEYLLILRARTKTSAGKADLYRNGTLLKSRARFGGWITTFTNVAALESIETVRRAGGSSAPHRLYILKADGVGMLKRVAGGGTAGGTQYLVPSQVPALKIVVGVLNAAAPARASILLNDAARPGHDTDLDGLGTELELQLGTCSTLTGIMRGFDCSLAADPADTDGDGLNDGWELLGRRDVEPHQPLPLWGASPRHKDLFMEVDFMLRSPGETALKMSPQQAREFASYFQDEIGTLTPEQSSAHAASLVNPDGRPGIRMHLDTGVPPETPQDATLYGDWGGYTATPPIQYPYGWGGVDFTQAWKTYMDPARFGVFRYALPYASGGGSVGPGYACAAGLENMRTLAHECAHALGLWSHSLEPVGSPDVNCKPNHPSLIDYAYLYDTHGFADGTGRPPLNNSSLEEWQAVPVSSQDYLSDLKHVFGYHVDFAQGHVDWNRNGVFEPAGRRIKAYANYLPWGNCEYTRYNQSRVASALSERAPAIARMGSRIYVFHIDLATGTVKYDYSGSPWKCSEPAPSCGGVWVGNLTASTGAMGTINGIDAARLEQRLVLVALDSSGRLWERELTLSVSGVETWSQPALIPGSTPASGEPALQTDRGKMVLVYKGTDQVVRYRVRGAQTGWGAENAVLDGGNPLSTSAYASPGIGVGYLQLQPAGQPPSLGIYGAFPDAYGYIDLWYFNAYAGKWEKTGMMDPRIGPVEGRPALGYAPYTYCCDSQGEWVTQEAGGTFYLYYTAQGSRLAGMMVSYMQVDALGNPAAQKIGLPAFYDNVWWSAYGLDVLPDTARSGSFFVAASLAVQNQAKNQVWLRPRSDGLLDYTYSNIDDWQILGRRLCFYLRDIGPLAPEPAITCPQ